MAQAQAVPQAGPPASGRALGEWLSLDDVLDRIEAVQDPVVALSITGGGASGAYQAGVIAEIFEAVARRRRERGRCAAAPRLVIGTSAGALNAFAFLLEALRPAPAAPHASGEPLVAALWRTIGSRNKGARFVTGGRARLVDWVTRWRKWRRLQRVVSIGAAVALLALVNPVLFAVLARERPGLAWLSSLVLTHPVTATVTGAVILVLLGLALAWLFGRALFKNVALRSTLANAARAAVAGRTPGYVELLRPVAVEAQQAIARQVVEAWREATDAPELIVTATDLTARWECLFALASPERCLRLAAKGWEVARIGGDGGVAADGGTRRLSIVHESELLRCVVASTSIPGVFPSQRIRLHGADGSNVECAHDFVDGGVLNNSPMNVAVDAGATHVISIELDPLGYRAPLDAAVPAHREPALVENVALTFATLLEMATTEDVFRTVSMNRAPGRRRVEIYRIAPAHRDLQTLDFNGHYDQPFAAPSPSLVEWLERAALDVRGGRPFWCATRQADP